MCPRTESYCTLLSVVSTPIRFTVLSEVVVRGDPGGRKGHHGPRGAAQQRVAAAGAAECGSHRRIDRAAADRGAGASAVQAQQVARRLAAGGHRVAPRHKHGLVDGFEPAAVWAAPQALSGSASQHQRRGPRTSKNASRPLGAPAAGRGVPAEAVQRRRRAAQVVQQQVRVVAGGQQQVVQRRVPANDVDGAPVCVRDDQAGACGEAEAGRRRRRQRHNCIRTHRVHPGQTPPPLPFTPLPLTQSPTHSLTRAGRLPRVDDAQPAVVAT